MTAHNGWTLHSAPPNFTGEDRLALAVSYVDGDAVVREGEREVFMRRYWLMGYSNEELVVRSS